MGQPIRYTICFGRLEAADAGRAAESLRRSLQEVDPTILAKRVRTDEEAMDFGASLAVILATPAMITLAKGISNWLARTPTSKLTVIGPDGKIIVEDITAKDAAHLAEKLTAHGSHGRR
jgi:hypothetical protein